MGKTSLQCRIRSDNVIKEKKKSVCCVSIKCLSKKVQCSICFGLSPSSSSSTKEEFWQRGGQQLHPWKNWRTYIPVGFTAVKRKNWRHIRSLPPRTFDSKAGKLLQEIVKERVRWKNSSSWDTQWRWIIKFPIHKRHINLNFPGTALTLGFKAKFYGKFKTLYGKFWRQLHMNCARALRLTAVCPLA